MIKLIWPTLVAVGALVVVAVGFAVAGAPFVPIAVAAVLAYPAWLLTTWRHPVTLERVLGPYLVAVGVQFLHLGEEYVAHFYERFPQLFGTPAWPRDGFVLAFIIGMGVVYVLTPLGVRHASPAANYVLWFVALGPMLVNSVAHPLAAVLVGGYFPGLYTAPLQLVVAVWLIWRLARPVGPGEMGTADRAALAP